MGRRSQSSSSNKNNNSKCSPHPFKDETSSSFTAAEAEAQSEAEEDKEPCNEQEEQLRVLLNELTFWEPDCSATSMPQDNNNHAGEMEQQQQQQQQRESTAAVAAVDSPTLKELEAANTWQKAVDPASGRTYYYDSITRQSQWEKVRMDCGLLIAISACVIEL